MKKKSLLAALKRESSQFLRIMKMVVFIAENGSAEDKNRTEDILRAALTP